MIEVYKRRAISDLKKEVKKQIGTVLYEQTNFDTLFETVIKDLTNDVKKWSDNEERIETLKGIPSHLIGQFKSALGVSSEDDDDEDW